MSPLDGWSGSAGEDAAEGPWGSAASRAPLKSIRLSSGEAASEDCIWLELGVPSGLELLEEAAAEFRTTVSWRGSGLFPLLPDESNASSSGAERK